MSPNLVQLKPSGVGTTLTLLESMACPNLIRVSALAIRSACVSHRSPPQAMPARLISRSYPAKNYMTGLHNGFGITYQPPTHTKTIASVSTRDLPRTTKYFHMPMSPMTLPPSSPPQLFSPDLNRPMSLEVPRDRAFTPGHRPHLSRSSNTASSEFLAFGRADHASVSSRFRRLGSQHWPC